MELTYRLIQPCDIETTLVLRGMTRDNPVTRERLTQLGITVDSSIATLQSGRTKGWVCVHNSQIVGYCIGDSEHAEVLVLAVMPDYEGKGIGKTLLSLVVDWLRSLGHAEIWLAASSNSKMRSHGFYRSLGWRPNGAKQSNGDEVMVFAQNTPARR